jgi:hypothetical protein
MGVYYGDKIYGIRWVRLNTDIDSYESFKTIFELKFQLLTKTYIDIIKDAFQKAQEEQNPEENIQYYFQRTMATTHEWCSNSDEVVYYAWVKCNKEDVEKLIQEC